jgi:hypothetical protein
MAEVREHRRRYAVVVGLTPGCESALKEELIGDRNALFESAAISEPFMEAGNDSTEHLFRIKILVGELLRGQGKQGGRAPRAGIGWRGHRPCRGREVRRAGGSASPTG